MVQENAPLLDIALAQINTQIGDLQGNLEQMKEIARQVRAQDADLVVFPECSFLAYPPRDLLTRHELIEKQIESLEKLAELTTEQFGIVTGFVDFNRDEVGKPLRNSAAFCLDGSVVERIHKKLLPTYDVFEEARYFEPGNETKTVSFGEYTLGITICEDAWAEHQLQDTPIYDRDPVAELADEGADLMLNIAASPFYHEKGNKREDLLREHAERHDTWLLYVNHVGGQDELIFDGRSFVANPEGQIHAKLTPFEEEVRHIDFSSAAQVNSGNRQESSSIADVYEGVSLGVRDYFRKTGFERALIGISGGIDSAMTAAVACEALGADQVLGISMPTRFTSNQSKTDAEELADSLGFELKHIPIESFYENSLEELSDYIDRDKNTVVWENIQARIRGMILMAFSNAQDRLLLATGNKSELSVGYCTLYGDMCGALSPLGDCPKEWIYEIARWLNKSRGREVIPSNIIEKAPSAELREDQTDQDDLPPYEFIDRVLEGYIEEGKRVDEFMESSDEQKTARQIVRRIQRYEYKRRQAAPALKVTEKAFGMGWRYPLSASYEDVR